MSLRSRSQGELGLQTGAADLQIQTRPSGQALQVRTLQVAMPTNNVALAIQTTPQRNVAHFTGDLGKELISAELRIHVHGSTLFLPNLNEIPGWIQS